MRSLVNAGFGIVFLLLLRGVFASVAMYNPLGDDLDFSPAPVPKDLLIGVALALATIGWAAACGSLTASTFSRTLDWQSTQLE